MAGKSEIKSESEMISQLAASPLELAPVTLTMQPTARTQFANCDAVATATWDGGGATFAIECKRLATPKEFATAVLQVQSWSLPEGTLPMLLLPYLKPEQLDELERLKISGVDLCGNGVITIPGRLMVYRTGQPNRFRSSAPIKNVYRGKTSLVARMFASQQSFPTVQALRDAIIERDPIARSGLESAIGLSTVSKALKTLEQDLIVAREDDGAIRLLQRNQLLNELMKENQPLEAEDCIRLKADVSDDNLVEWIAGKIDSLDIPVSATGLSSTSQYAVMQRGPIMQLYTPDISAVATALAAPEADRFENIVLIKSKRAVDYFDSRWDKSFRWASPLQTWLELMRGDKRDREAAVQVRKLLLASGSGT